MQHTTKSHDGCARLPTRAMFEPLENQKLTYAERGHAVDELNDAKEDEGAE